jgi:hypothetical protein
MIRNIYPIWRVAANGRRDHEENFTRDFYN